MYAVTQGAIFDYRIVFPQEGAAFFCMAGIAIVVNRELFQSGRAHGAVRIVAVAAYELVFTDGMR